METRVYPAGRTAVYRFDASGTPKAVILLVHGLGEHAGRYATWAGRFNASGISVRAFDLPGHGLSEGRRGVISSLEKVYDTIDIMLKEISAEMPGIPVFLYGHSLGGIIILSYLVRRKPDVRGAVVTSPWLKLVESPPKIKLLMASLVRRIYPGLTQPSGLNADYLSHDAEVVSAYRNDRLVHGMISTGLYFSVVDAASETLSRAREISVPLLIAHGKDDRLTLCTESARVGEAVPKATVRLWEGGYHELHNDLMKDDHFKFIIDWLDPLIR